MFESTGKVSMKPICDGRLKVTGRAAEMELLMIGELSNSDTCRLAYHIYFS